MQDINCCYLPTYLSSSIYYINSKKIVIGVDKSFEIKVLFASICKNGFIELSQQSMLNFLISLKQVQLNIENLKSSTFDFGENIILKINFKNSNVKIRLIDSRREITLFLSQQELKRVENHEKILLYVLQKLTLNQSSFLSIYAEYLKIASEKGTLDLSVFDACRFNSFENYTIDFLKVFLEFYPIFGAEKIYRDTSLYKMTKQLNDEII